MCWVPPWVEQFCRICAVQWHDMVKWQQSISDTAGTLQSPACSVGTQDPCGWPSWPACSTARDADRFLSQPTKQTKEGWGHGDNSKSYGDTEDMQGTRSFVPGELGMLQGIWGSEPSHWREAGSHVDKSSFLHLISLHEQTELWIPCILPWPSWLSSMVTA